MPTFSNTNDKTAIKAIIVKILFFLMKSIMNMYNLFIKFLYKIINNFNYYINYDGAIFARVILELNLEYIISFPKNNHLNYACLLYTSDAADE